MNEKTNYGYCPKCQGKGISRERHIQGKTRCENKHIFLSCKWDEWNKNNKKPDFKARGWKTPYGFIDYIYPVTYERACKDMKMQTALINWDK